MPRVPDVFKMNSDDETGKEAFPVDAGDVAPDGARDAAHEASVPVEHFVEEQAPDFQGPTTSEWRCLRCDGDRWERNVYGVWLCCGCDGTEFYSCNRPHRHETDEGVWMFMPRRPTTQGRTGPRADGPGQQLPSKALSRRERRRQRVAMQPGGGPPEPDYDGNSELPESEAPTFDPIVATEEDDFLPGEPTFFRTYLTTATLDFASHDNGADRGQPFKAVAAQLRGRAGWDQNVGRDGAEATWRYDAQDPRAYSKFAKKAALMLYTSLTGEAETELEHAPIESINSDKGIEFILETLRAPMEQKLVFQKRKFLSEYENIQRQQGEGLRSFSNRYRRAERNLRAVGVEVGQMYDNDSRGNHLLERARLSPQDQRLILVGSRRSFVLRLRCAAGTDSRFPAKAMAKESPALLRRLLPRLRTGTAPKATLAGVEEAALEEIPEEESQDERDDHQADDAADAPDNDDFLDNEPDESADPITEALDVLTVTAKKLSSLKLGRKFSGGPRDGKGQRDGRDGKGAGKDVAAQKRVTHCAACGERGHWKGDPECPMTTSSQRPSSSSSSATPGGTGGNKDRRSHQAFFVKDFGALEVTDQPANKHYGKMFQVNVVFGVQARSMHEPSFRGMMILDTACQRTCCGTRWLAEQAALLDEQALQWHSAPLQDVFQFGSGPPLKAKQRAYLPVGIGGVDLLIGAGALEVEIPLLASNRLLDALGMVLDLPNNLVTFTALHVTVPLLRYVAALLDFKKNFFVTLTTAVRLGMLPDSVYEAVPPILDNQFANPPSSRKRPEYTRYGNAYGKFARCKRLRLQAFKFAASLAVFLQYCTSGLGVFGGNPQTFDPGLLERGIAQDLLGTTEARFPTEPAEQQQRDGRGPMAPSPGRHGPGLRLGTRRRLKGDWARSARILESEVDMYQGQPSTAARPPHTVDLLVIHDFGFDLCGDAAELKLSSTLLPAVLTNDLPRGPASRRQALRALRRLRPHVLCVSLLDHHLYDFEDGFLFEMMQEQMDAGRASLVIGPSGQGLQGVASSFEMNCTTFGHGRAATTLATTIPGASSWFGKDDHGYTPDFVHHRDAFLYMIRDYVCGKDPARFGIFQAFVTYQSPVSRLEEWDDIAEMLSRSFGNPGTRPYYIDPSSEAVQTPSQRRLPQDIPYTRRCGILVYGHLIADELQVPVEVRRSIARAHINLGHPTAQELIRMATASGSPRPQAPRPATATTNAFQFGDRVEVDIFYLRDLQGRSCMILGAVDVATRVHQAGFLRSREPQDAYDVLDNIWLKPFGLMTQIALDPDTTFQGAFQERLRSRGVMVDYCAAEAHWQIGHVERQNAFLRTVMEKLVDTFAATSVTDIKLLLAPALHAVNSMTLSRGRSALPRLPGGLLSDFNVLTATPTDDPAATAEIIRLETLKTLYDLNVRQSMRRAILRKTRDTKVPQLQPGQACSFWRWRKKGLKKRGGWITARFLSWDPASPGKMAWVRSGTTTALVAVEQLRAATGFEAWLPTEPDVAALKDASQTLDQALWTDETGPAPDQRQQADDAEMPDLDALAGKDMEMAAALTSASSLPAAAASSSTPPPVETSQVTLDVDQTVQNLVYRPTVQNTFVRNVARLGDAQEPLTSATGETRGGHTNQRSYQKNFLNHLSLRQSLNHYNQPSWSQEAASADSTSSARPPTTPVTSEPSAQEGGYGPKEERCYKACLNSKHRLDDVQNLDKQAADSDTSDSDWSDVAPSTKERGMSRAEAKALDREIPWRQILDMDPADIKAYVAATEKEAKSWLEWGSVKPLSHTEAQSVLRDKVLAKRVLRTRSCFRDKNKGLGQLAAKCRVVALGHRDPDIYRLNRECATPNRTSEHVLFIILTSGSNSEFADSIKKWFGWAGDASTAFLQGRSDCFDFVLEGPLYLVCTNVYGLSNAPRLWSLTVIKRLTDLNYRQHSFDKMVFPKFCPQGHLLSTIIVYVDDFLGAYRSDYNLDEVKEAFKWGSLQDFEVGKAVTFKGKQITLKQKANGRHYLHVCQKEFIGGMTSGKVPRGADLSSTLTAEQRAEFRSVTGCLQWVSGQSRPELSAVNSLSNHGGATTLADLKALYEAVNFASATKDNGFIIPDVPVNTSSVLLSLSDASWANAENCRSQCGVLVLLCAPHVLEKPAEAMLLDWRSSRSQRVCRSTLAAEASAADEGCDRGVYINLFLSEILCNVAAHKVKPRLSQLAVTDAKSLYDCVVSDSPNLSDKRSLVNIRAIQEVVPGSSFHWVPTQLMFADGLTKHSKELQQTMHDWLQQPKVTLKQQDS
ncbi:RE2 [Symbiodinium necroappetens]|uniref:RE2 protein n=1 Tax=Symbiodinium necroappetens TaxID=1628268 RepID=A0A812ZWC0_9DINO|nr:RE2 [Symbiodinium necroappetens]